MNKRRLMLITVTVVLVALSLLIYNLKLRDEAKADGSSKAEKISSTNFQFSTQTIFGKDIDSKIFKDYKLTMINFWGTTCSPCVKEMPDIQKLYEEESINGINVIGVAIDVNNEATASSAKDIVNKTGVKYNNLMPSKAMMDYLGTISDSIPTTIFVDSKGKVIGDAIIGAQSKAEYKTIILERLAMIK